MKNTSKFQNVVIATIVGWLVLFVFLPNLMIIVTSFLTRDDANFVAMVFTLDNYARLLDPLYFDVKRRTKNAKAFHDKCENSYPTVPSLGQQPPGDLHEPKNRA
ncbi:hypothetical protein ACLFKX_09490, partial [Enterobacter hormaechei]